jgi:hypothetical protein
VRSDNSIPKPSLTIPKAIALVRDKLLVFLCRCYDYCVLTDTTESDKNLIRVLAHVRVPQEIIEASFTLYYSHVAS